MKVLVTGASGHLGAHLTRLLVQEGFDVRAMVRPSSNIEALKTLKIERVYGDVLNRESLVSAMKGCRFVFHLGCPTSLEKGLFETITKGMDNVLSASLEANIERLVYTSSIVTIGYSDSRKNLLDESSSQRTDASTYHSGKWQAEQSALEFSRRSGLDLVITNPSTIVGSLDYRVTPSNAPIQQCIDRGLPVAFDSGVTVVHAADVAQGHLLALRKGRSGERYILGGNRVTIADYFSLISKVCNKPAPKIVLPKVALLAAGSGFSLLNSFGLKVPFTFKQAKVLAGRYGWYSSAKASNELGYTWRSLEESIRSYVDWKRNLNSSELDERSSADSLCTGGTNSAR